MNFLESTIENPKTESPQDSMSNISCDVKLEISEEVYRKIIYWVDKCPMEISGLGKVIFDQENNIIKVIDTILIKQTNSCAETEIDAAAIGKAMFLLKDSPGDLRYHWHSHANMNVFWSATDQSMIKMLGANGWFCATVFNKKREMLSAYTQGAPVRLVVPNIETKIEQVIDPALTSKWDEEYAANVTEKSYQTIGGSSNMDLNNLFAEYHRRWPDDGEEPKVTCTNEDAEAEEVEEVEEKKEVELTDEQYQEYSDLFDKLYEMHQEGKLTDDEFDANMSALNVKYGFDEDDTSELEDTIEADAMDLFSGDKEETYEGFKKKYGD
jgi:hypothetical protein